MRRIVTTNNPQPVAAGQTATVNLSTANSLVYHHLYLIYDTDTTDGPTRANMEAEITAVRIKVDGREQRKFSAKQLFAIQALEGYPIRDGMLPIFLSDPNARTAQGEDALAWGMKDVSTFQVEVDIASGASNPSLRIRAEVERVDQPRPLQPITKWTSFVIPVTSTGKVDWTTAPKIDSYYGIYAFESSDGDINSVQVQVDGDEVVNADRSVIQSQLALYGYEPQTALVPILFKRTGRVSDLVSMEDKQSRVSEFRFDFDMAQANSFSVIAETMGPRN